jgi:CHAD domain-containing protein
MTEHTFAEIEFPPLASQPANPAWPFGLYAQHTILTRFRELLDQRAVVWQNEDVEGVHQIRVAARRCRTALQTFAPLWPEADVRKFLRYLTTLADTFGTARDLDVMVIYLHEQLANAEGDAAVAYRWLLARNEHLRQDEQPEIEKVLAKVEEDHFAQAFVAYFSAAPVDMWAQEGQDG